MRPHLSPIVISLLFGPALSAQSKFELPAVFSDHMVLQRGVTIPIWGWAAPGSEVVATLAGESARTRTASDGRFLARLPKMSAGGPYTLVLAADKKITITDVLVGEVWLGSGQSNMAMTVRVSRDFEKEKAGATLPRIRMFTVKRASRAAPQDKCDGDWKVCSPATVGAFSAAAFFFGRELHADLDVPVGLINSSWGGTAIEAWTSLDVQKGVAALRPVLAPWNRKSQAWSAVNAAKKHKLALARWKKRAAAAKAASERAPRRPRKPVDPALDQNHPANLYNGMIAPLIPYAIRGAIWYQGERNARTIESAKRYRIQMPKLIDDWRRRWGADFAFGIVQLPNFKVRKDDPSADSAWATMRESMLRSLAVPHTGLAVTIDIGEARNIHPKDKQTVGGRLARWALADVYGQDIVGSGPLLKSSAVDGHKLVLTFRHAGGGLRTRGGGPVQGFAIAGADRKWHWAHAEIAGARITVAHPDVLKPMAIRYAWGDNPACNLINAANLPASPFRTDTW